MGLWVRRLLALGGMLAALVVFPAVTAVADTPSPPPSTAASTPAASGTPSSTATSTDGDDEDADTPDAPLDDTRTMLALVGAGVLAVVAGAVVFLRR